MALKIIITERFSLEALSYLKGHKHEIVADWSQADAAIIRSKTKIDKSVLEKAANLKIIVTSTSGYDHIDLNETATRKVKVYYTPDGNAQSAAELTMGLLLASARKLITANQNLKSGDWNRETVTGVELNKKILGIVGLGRVGSRVAKMAQAFGMTTVAFDPYQKNEMFTELNTARLSFTEVVRVCDVLTMHVPYTKETHHMLNARSLDEIQPHCILINTSRGPVINELDLIQMLIEKRIAAAGLDVFSKEPLPKDSPLLALSNLVLTPHIGASTEEAFQQASRLAAQIVIDFFNGQSCENELFPKGTPTFNKFN